MKLIQIDGSTGGGQMLRTALSLAMVTGQPFRMTNIRAGRSRPGLMRQHLTCVRAACEISDGTADGAEMGSTELVFRAGKIRPGSYQFAIGTAGSTSLLFQTLLPALLFAGGPSSLRLEGGTHHPMAPPFDFIERVFLPALRTMGAEVTAKLVRIGFAPAGGGCVEFGISPVERLQALELTSRPEEGATRIRVLTRDLPLSIAGRMLDAALEMLPLKDAAVETCEPGACAGLSCLVETQFGTCAELCSAHGEVGLTAERIGRQAAKGMKDFLSCGAPVGRHLADQLLLPMALAGRGEILSAMPDAHLATNLEVIAKFLPVEFRVKEAPRGCRVISLG